jgi:hypothetical protein
MVVDGADRRKLGDAVVEIFNKIKYRGDFIDATEKVRAYNYGKAVGLKEKGFKNAEIVKDSNCESCKDAPDLISLDNLTVHSVPPYHANSKAYVGSGVE